MVWTSVNFTVLRSELKANANISTVLTVDGSTYASASEGSWVTTDLPEADGNWTSSVLSLLNKATPSEQYLELSAATVNDFKEVVKPNAISPMETTEAEMVTEVRAVQSPNAPAPIVVTESGTSMDVRDSQ